MEIKYATKTLGKVLGDERLIQKSYGPIAGKLILRLSDLRVADNLSQITHLPPPRRHKLVGDWKGCWGIDLSKNQRLVIRPIGEYDIENLETINTVRIEAIEDYH